MKVWSALLPSLLVSAPVFAADANQFQVFNFDRGDDNALSGNANLPGRLWVPSTPPPPGGYQLVTFFHGFGERGENSTLNVSQVNSIIDNLFAAAQARGFILYAPQSWNGWHREDYHMAGAQIAKLLNTYNIDPSRVHLTGVSNGGRGTLEMGTLYDDAFASLMPVCAQMENYWDQTIAAPAVLAQLPIWMHHARLDPQESARVEGTREGVNRIRAAKGLEPIVFPDKNNPPPGYYVNSRHDYNDGLLRYTEYENGGHSNWVSVYPRNSVYDWMLSQTKSNPQQLQLGETLRFDLGSSHINSTSSGNHWNSTFADFSRTSGTVQGFAITEDGRRTAVTMDVTNTFHGDSTTVPAGLSTPGRDAWVVQNFGGGDNLGEITLSGLTEGGHYDLELFGSSTEEGFVRYTVNGVAKTLNFQNNLSTTVNFDGIVVGASGTLTIQVEAVGATRGYLNWFTITSAPVPEPAAAALLGPAVLLFARRHGRGGD